ncbi:hypothetical protein AALP_AA8G094200 [Arabis alpina]|uniref:Protein HEAT INTOLERANT 4-like n=1 Tax=Arabis alpina TaxID=50452 RepID=A0A087G5Z5_ARAAL|nr:hypothetical protein AALP_AA8G094200 [Arabis alpina]
MRKGAKRKGGRKAAVAASQDDEVIVDSIEASTQEETQQTQEEVVGENGGEAVKENLEDDGEKDEPVKDDGEIDDEVKDDEVKDDSPSEKEEDEKVVEEVNEDKKKPARGGGKRKRGTKKETEKNDEKKPAPRAKKPRVTKPKEEPEYFEDERNLEGLWKAAFPVGTEWDQVDSLNDFKWDFRNLEEALEEGGKLYGKKVFLFGCAEPQLVPINDVNKIIHVPTVVVVESPFPPSDKIAITSVQKEEEEIIPMKRMKMEWVPYIPLEKRDRQVDRVKFQIYIMCCTQRRAALRRMKEDQVKKFEYCLPYFYHPFREDELEQSKEVQIMFPSEPPVVCEFDWEFDEVEEFTDKLIEEEALAAEQKDEFKEYVKEQVRAAKKANREAREARKKTIEEMSEETKQAFQSMKFYKFYPKPSPDVPTFMQSKFINRYYGNAHEVL